MVFLECHGTWDKGFWRGERRPRRSDPWIVFWRNSRSWTASMEEVGRVQENSMSKGMAWDTGCKAGTRGINYRWGKKGGQRPSYERSCELFQGIWSLTHTTVSTFWTLNILNSLTSHLWPSTFPCSCCSKGAQWPPSWPIQWNLTCFL